MRIGIIGAGQLGQMLGIAARDLDIECRFLDPAAAPPAASVGPVITRPFNDADALAALADDCDIVTYEFENVPVEALLRIADRVPVYPPPDALRLAQDRLAEKKLFDGLRIPSVQYCVVDSLANLETAASSLGLPLVVKTRRLGYDGKGQFLIQKKNDIDEAWLMGKGTGFMSALIDHCHAKTKHHRWVEGDSTTPGTLSIGLASGSRKQSPCVWRTQRFTLPGFSRTREKSSARQT